MYDYVRDLGGPLMTALQNVILAITALVAIRAIRSNETSSRNQIEHQEVVERKKSTLDLILNMTADAEYNKAREVVVRMRSEGVNAYELRSAMKNMTKSEDERRLAAERYRAAQYLLNKLSLFAVGISNDLLDEQSFKTYYYSTFVVLVEYLKYFIIEVRSAASQQIKNQQYVSHETIYRELTALLDRWKAEPLHRHR